MGYLTIICVFTLIVASISSLPIKTVDTSGELLKNGVNVVHVVDIPSTFNEDNDTVRNTTDVTFNGTDNEFNKNGNIARNQIRPGMVVTNYDVEITPNINDGTFNARLLAQVSILDQDTREFPIIFNVADLNVNSVQFSIGGGTVYVGAWFEVDDGILEIFTDFEAMLYNFIIEYSGTLDVAGQGLYLGSYDGGNYIAMNLHPTNARRVFPCIDEPTEAALVTFTFNDMEHNSIVSNSMLQENSQTQFRPLLGPLHTWGMVSHNLNNINIPIANVLLYARPGVNNQDAQASVAINFFFTYLNEWTDKPYLEIIVNQDGRMHIFALPDINSDWYALSTVCIWEPYILMETTHSIKQRATALTTIAEAMARQWFGYVIYPENWRYQWVITGLAKYTAYEMMKEFQHDPTGNDITLLDVDTLFVTEVVQESLLLDAYTTAEPIEPVEDVFEENEIRYIIHGLSTVKAPAILRMLRLVLGNPEQDFVQSGARALLNTWSLQTVNSLNFYDAINSAWLFEGNEMVPEIAEFLDPFISSTGYPLLHVGLRQGGLLLTQEHFSFTGSPTRSFMIPISYTTSVNPDFETVHPEMMLDVTTTLNTALGPEDWVVFNIQGQGYYRVNYDGELWERILEALYDPERREEIHPTNRATLVDDALNLARASKLDYEVAFHVVLSMELEAEYAVWKAFVRNMNFLKKHLVARVTEDEELDPDIYLRMVRRTIMTFENEVGFYPDPLILEPAMTSLTRGLVMDHACRANYQPCIAAAIDWFFDPNDITAVNPNIPHEIRPAVYCAMMSEGGANVIEALENRLEIEPSHYERVVILESFACSRDDQFILQLLQDTINTDKYSIEERSRIFKAVAESSYNNARSAIGFLSLNTPEIRNAYGGPAKLEDLIFALSNNIASEDLLDLYLNYINSVNSGLDDSLEVAVRARERAIEDLAWNAAHLEAVYEWIDENDAPTLIVSSLLITLSLLMTLFNY